MFKRIAKKVKRKERDEELGLDEETKQVLGLHDTDSDESESDSSLGSDSDSDASEESDFDEGSEGDMKMEWLGAERYDSEEEGDSDDSGLDLEEDFDEDEDPPMSLDEATKKPIYLTSTDPDIHVCIVCPKKALKNAKMVEVHLKSAVRLIEPPAFPGFPTETYVMHRHILDVS